MRFLLRKIATSLRRLSFLPVGYNRTLNLWSLLSLRNSLYRVFIVWIASSLVLAIFGIGLHQILDEFLSPVVASGRISQTIISSVLACSLWIFMVSMNHIHDLTGLWSDISHYYELIWWIPAYISVALIGPLFNLIYWIVSWPFNGEIFPFRDLTLIREFSDFFLQTVPVFFWYIKENVADFVSAIITFDDIRVFGELIYNFVVEKVATVIGYVSPAWVQETRIGRWALLSISSSIVSLAIIRLIIRLFWGW